VRGAGHRGPHALGHRGERDQDAPHGRVPVGIRLAEIGRDRIDAHEHDVPDLCDERLERGQIHRQIKGALAGTGAHRLQHVHPGRVAAHREEARRNGVRHTILGRQDHDGPPRRRPAIRPGAALRHARRDVEEGETLAEPRVAGEHREFPARETARPDPLNGLGDHRGQPHADRDVRTGRSG
jgi:hypothetical protein